MKKWICATLVAFVLTLVPFAQAASTTDVRGAQPQRAQAGHKHAAGKHQKKHKKKSRQNRTAKRSRKP